MDAALDAMRQFGFPERLVRVTVRELLEVYTGEWHFIEVDAYTTLIEALLEKQNQLETKEIEASTSSRKDGDTSKMLIARPSSGVALSEHEAEVAVNDIEAAAESSSRVDEALPLAAALPTLEIDCPPGFEGYRRGCKDVRRDHDSGGGRQASASTRNGEDSKDILQSTMCLLPPCGSVPRVGANGVHPRGRRCYHGWIGGEEDAEKMQLAPPLLPEFLTKFFSGMEKQRPWGKRKRRWDVRPDDL